MSVTHFWNSRDWPATFQAIANIAQVVALAVAGWWTYSRFIRQRSDHERATLEHALVQLGATDKRRLIRVEVTVKNIGNVILMPPSATVRIYQVLPLPAVIAGAIEAARSDDVTRDKPADCEFPWPRIAKMPLKLGPDYMTLEPSESDAFACDFAIPLEVTAVFVRTELLCGIEDVPDLHWHHETFHKFT